MNNIIQYSKTYEIYTNILIYTNIQMTIYSIYTIYYIFNSNTKLN